MAKTHGGRTLAEASSLTHATTNDACLFTYTPRWADNPFSPGFQPPLSSKRGKKGSGKSTKARPARSPALLGDSHDVRSSVETGGTASTCPTPAVGIGVHGWAADSPPSESRGGSVRFSPSEAGSCSVGRGSSVGSACRDLGAPTPAPAALKGDVTLWRTPVALQKATVRRERSPRPLFEPSATVASPAAPARGCHAVFFCGRRRQKVNRAAEVALPAHDADALAEAAVKHADAFAGPAGKADRRARPWDEGMAVRLPTPARLSFEGLSGSPAPPSVPATPPPPAVVTMSGADDVLLGTVVRQCPEARTPFFVAATPAALTGVASPLQRPPHGHRARALLTGSEDPSSTEASASLGDEDAAASTEAVADVSFEGFAPPGDDATMTPPAPTARPPQPPAEDDSDAAEVAAAYVVSTIRLSRRAAVVAVLCDHGVRIARAKGAADAAGEAAADAEALRAAIAARAADAQTRLLVTAATAVQAIRRGTLARRRVAGLRNERVANAAAASVVRAAARGYYIRMTHVRACAAVAIQVAWRGARARALRTAVADAEAASLVRAASHEVVAGRAVSKACARACEEADRLHVAAAIARLSAIPQSLVSVSSPHCCSPAAEEEATPLRRAAAARGLAFGGTNAPLGLGETGPRSHALVSATVFDIATLAAGGLRVAYGAPAPASILEAAPRTGLASHPLDGGASACAGASTGSPGPRPYAHDCALCIWSAERDKDESEDDEAAASSTSFTPVVWERSLAGGYAVSSTVIGSAAVRPDDALPKGPGALFSGV